MLYALNVFSSATKPLIWDAMDGVKVRKFQTANIEPLGEKATEEKTLAAAAERRLVRALDDSDVYIYSDGFGCIHAGKDSEHTTLLSKCTWLQISSLWLRVELIREPASTWDEKVVQQLSPWRRFVNRLFRRTCETCMYFDAAGAQEWRSMVTHAFGGAVKGADVALYCKMWDDVTKQEAVDHKAPDFKPKEFGYCPKHDCGLSKNLMACDQYEKKVKEK